MEIEVIRRRIIASYIDNGLSQAEAESVFDEAFNIAGYAAASASMTLNVNAPDIDTGRGRAVHFLSTQLTIDLLRDTLVDLRDAFDGSKVIYAGEKSS